MQVCNMCKVTATASGGYPWALELGLMKVCCRSLCCELPPVVPGCGPAKPSTTLLASLLKPVGIADRGPEAVEKAGVLFGCPVGIKTCHHEPSKCRSSINIVRDACVSLEF